jgi:hypothetical protein
MTTTKQLESAIEVAATIYKIVAAHTDGIPSGHLYALVMPCFDDLGAYESCVSMLENSRLIRREGLKLFASHL